MKRDNHYEVAFEAYLRVRGVVYVAVDEARRSLLGDGDVKSLDFVIVGPDNARLVVDVKGRKFPGTSGGKLVRTWQNWCEREDVDSLLRWAGTFGPGFRGVLAFVYHVQPSVVLPDDTPDLFAFRDRLYLMRAIEATDYAAHMQCRSPRWDTVHLFTSTFRQLVRPFSHFLARIPAARIESKEVVTAENAER
jgi:hypothetical protein